MIHYTLHCTIMYFMDTTVFTYDSVTNILIKPLSTMNRHPTKIRKLHIFTFEVII